MTSFLKKKNKLNCPHCNKNSFAYKNLLKETENFRIVCDVHPLVEGHLLIIPKKHHSCVGEYPNKTYEEFISLYKIYSDFIKKEYGSIATFEHGKIGQTVFHSHVHLLPYSGTAETIIPEGKKFFMSVKNLNSLKNFFEKDGKYLFFSLGKNMYLVDLKLGVLGFFRDRFAKALGNPTRGSWKTMKKNKLIMKKANIEIKRLKKKYEKIRKRT
jgi:diadenosine tetraphosphate (Ap4A) HIT family hydrolase